MGDPTLTVCIPTYNRPEFLSQCLQSLLAQTYGDFVVVILDNASTVDYSWVLREQADPRVSYRRHATSLGSVGNIALALREYRDAPYLMVFHDDDVMYPRLIEWQLQALQERPRAVLAASVMQSFRTDPEPPFRCWESVTGRFETLATSADLAISLLQSAMLHFGSAMYLTAALRGTKLDTERFGIICDRPLLLDIAEKGSVILFPEPLVLYRAHPTQDSQTGTVSQANLLELYARYRLSLSPWRSAVDRRLFYRVATNELLASYVRLPKRARSGLRQFVAECRTRRLFGWRYLRRGGLAALCDVTGIGWAGRVMYPVALVRRLRPRHRLRTLRRKVLCK